MLLVAGVASPHSLLPLSFLLSSALLSSPYLMTR